MSRRVLVLPSEHGRGHLKRMATLARALQRRGADAAGPASLARTCEEEWGEELATAQLPPLRFGARLWDARAHGRLAEEVDALRAESGKAVEEWTRALERQRADVVAVDADPWPLAAAAALGLPAVLVSNFTWLDLARAWGADAEWMAELHAGAAACELPFPLGLAGIVRERTRVPHIIDPAPPVSPPDGSFRVLYALGKGNPDAPRALHASEPTLLRLPSDADPPQLRGPIRVERFEGPVHLQMGASHIVLTKGSYATVAEAVAARRPLALRLRAGGPEDVVIARALVAVGAARVIEDEARLPTRAEVDAMSRAYAGEPEWARCDPDAAARAVLASARS